MDGIAIPTWSAMESGLSGSVSEGFLDALPLDSNAPYRAMLLLLIAANLWTLVLTTIPVVLDLPRSDYYAGRPQWFTGDDVMRLIEPVGGALLQFAVLLQSGVFKENMNRSARLCVGVFLLGLALYQQGAGYHSAANMFKNALETEMSTEDDALHALWYYTRVVWEHAVSHYLYAAGYGVMNAAQLWAYRLVRAPHMGLTKTGYALLLLSALVYGALIALVAIEFPSGTIVALAYLVLWLGGVGAYVVWQRSVEGDIDIVRFGHRPVLHHFLLGHGVALALVVSWIAAVGGFKDRAQAGYL